MTPPLHLDLTVDGHAEAPQLHAAIKAALRRLLPAFAPLNDDAIEVTTVSGGISNALYKAAPSAAAAAAGGGSAAPPAVAFRIYGDSTEEFIDRSRELGVMRLAHEHGFGPQLLATFTNGRVEAFLPMRSLEPEEMAALRFVPSIAATLRRFHGMPAPGDRQHPQTPFGRILQWLDMAEKFTFDCPEKQRLFESFDFAAMRAEVAAVQAAAAAVASPPAFCHNDLLSGNIMIPLAPDNGSSSGGPGPAPAAGGQQAQQAQQGQQAQQAGMTFIDFEYADWAPRGFDWGNHFCEYAGFDCDYSRYPDRAQATQFVRCYLAAGGAPEDAAAAQDEAHVARCVVEANVYALAAHQFWGTWSFLQAKWSKIDFDYLQYAALRWGEYHRRKAEFLSAALALAQQG